MQDRYLEPHQARKHEPTAYENLFGDSLERAFTQGIHELPGLVDYLNTYGPPGMDARPWTEEILTKELARLAN
ncbi:Uncharacterised protein [Mycobacteroides abscessus subsp. abscessus]|nr:Uncharacterised protein [Mycobacteroides abscessus subsp. abscessus]